MIVCHCAVVTDGGVTEAWDAGARSLGQVCRATGAGTDCGACIFSVKRLLCEHEASRTLSPSVAEHRPATGAVEVVKGAAS
ncbi:bacterioferritin-associated ferredoxin [Terrabacter sp. BE26]|uniref:(2Fe-2S)-binding protein n=1 Tax=Terrabacter sp. BE26 TaxID=2898152 RepID=UPI0035BE5C46